MKSHASDAMVLILLSQTAFRAQELDGLLEMIYDLASRHSHADDGPEPRRRRRASRALAAVLVLPPIISGMPRDYFVIFSVSITKYSKVLTT